MIETLQKGTNFTPEIQQNVTERDKLDYRNGIETLQKGTNFNPEIQQSNNRKGQT